MKHIFISTIFLLLLSCVTGSRSVTLIGTTGARYGINPYPNKELWVESIYALVKSSNIKAEKSILWNVGSYSPHSILLNFPGKNSDNLEYSSLDYNNDFFDFFDKKSLNIYLLIEPNSLNVQEVVLSALNNYKSHSSIKGVCLDFEWLESGIIPSDLIESIYSLIKKENRKYKLIIKHWNINIIEPYINENVIYVQSMEGVNDLEEIKKRHSIWARNFYPCPVGIEIGFPGEYFWVNYENPIEYIMNQLSILSVNDLSLFWCESTLVEYLNK